MKVPALTLTIDLQAYVDQLLEDWAPDCIRYPPPSPSPPTLHDLFDISTSPVCVESDGPSDTEAITISSTSDGASPLHTPAVSPEPESPAADLSSELLMCLEDMPTFDESDEVKSASGAFSQWPKPSCEIDAKPMLGCLRCAYFQDIGANSVCGLCYLKALSEGKPVYMRFVAVCALFSVLGTLGIFIHFCSAVCYACEIRACCRAVRGYIF